MVIKTGRRFDVLAQSSTLHIGCIDRIKKFVASPSEDSLIEVADDIMCWAGESNWCPRSCPLFLGGPEDEDIPCKLTDNSVFGWSGGDESDPLVLFTDANTPEELSEAVLVLSELLVIIANCEKSPNIKEVAVCHIESV